MTKRTYKDKIIVYILVIFMLVSVIPAVYAADVDYAESWAKDVITYYIERGVVFPDDDGNIQPRKPMTRAEVAMLINKSLGFTKTAEINYTDVMPIDPFYKDLQIAKGMGYMIGGGEKQPFRPYDPITRQEMSILVARVLELQPNIEAAKIFVDFDDMPTDEAKGAIGAMADPSVKVLEGVGEGLFDPNYNITRDQAYTMIYRAEKIYWELQSGKRQYSSINVFQKEPFGDISIQKNYNNVEVFSQEITLRNITVWGDLTIHGGVNSGNIELDNVIIKGNTNIHGGDSVKINNGKLNIVTIKKAVGAVQLDFAGTSSVSKISAHSEVTINATSMTIPEITISETMEDAAISISAANVGNIDIESGAIVSIETGVVQGLTIGYSADGTVVYVQEPATVVNATVKSMAGIGGKGTVTTAKLSSLGALVTTPYTKITDMFGNTFANDADGKALISEPTQNPTAASNTDNTNNSNNSELEAYLAWYNTYINSQNQNQNQNSNNSNNSNNTNNSNNNSNINNNTDNANNNSAANNNGTTPPTETPTTTTEPPKNTVTPSTPNTPSLPKEEEGTRVPPPNAFDGISLTYDGNNTIFLNDVKFDGDLFPSLFRIVGENEIELTSVEYNGSAYVLKFDGTLGSSEYYLEINEYNKRIRFK